MIYTWGFLATCSILKHCVRYFCFYFSVYFQKRAMKAERTRRRHQGRVVTDFTHIKALKLCCVKPIGFTSQGL